MTDTVETAVYRLRVEGQDQLGKLKSQLDGVTVSEEKATAATRTTTEALERRIARLDPIIRAQERYRKELEAAARFAQSGVGSEDQRNAQIELATQRYNKTVQAIQRADQATKQLNATTGLARHEMINLSRQVQDVGVSLASGQSPLTVLFQQGSQIADVFASSAGSVRGFFSQSIGWATRFAASTAGVVTGVAAITTGVAAMAMSWSSAQREIDKALATPGGAASGLSRGGINRIAEQGSSAFGLSVSEAREAATAFASTGKIYEDNILRATLITKQFALALGMDVGEASKKLAQDLMSPAAAASEWAKKISGIDADTVNYVRSLENMGNKQAAINQLIVAAIPGLAKQAEQVGLLTRAYDFAANALSDWWERQKQTAARVGDFATGGNSFGSRSDEEQLSRLQGRQSDLLRSRTPGLDAAELRHVTEAIAELEKKMADLRKATEGQRFADLSNQANDLARSINTTETQIEGLTQKLQVLERVQSERSARGLVADPGLDEAVRKAQDLLALTIEQSQVEKNRARYVNQTVMAYEGVSTATALALDKLETQNNVARQVAEAGRMKAQAEADFLSLVSQGVAPLEAQQVASAQLAINQTNATTNVMQQVQALQDQTRLSRANEGSDRARVASAIAYRNAIESGADEQAAAALKAATYAAEMEKAANSARRVRDELSQANLNAMQAQLPGAIVVGAQSMSYSPGGDGTDGDPRGPSFLSDNTFGDKSYGPAMSNAGFGLFLSGRLASANTLINGALSGGVDSALSSLRNTNFQSTNSRGLNFGMPSDLNSVFPGYGSQGDINNAVSQLFDLKLAQAGNNKEAREEIYADQLQWLQQQPMTIQNMRAIVDLQRALRDLEQSVDANTDAQSASLNPLYTEGRSALSVGYYKAASGLDMIAQGPPSGDQVPFHAMVNGGERITITPAGQQQPANSGSKTIVQNNTFNFGSSGTTKRRSERQLAQNYGQMMASLS